MTDKSPPAFPFDIYANDETQLSYGISLRDYFAGQVLAGLMSDHNMEIPISVQLSYKAADLMLAERDKSNA